MHPNATDHIKMMQSCDQIDPHDTFINKTITQLLAVVRRVYIHFPAWYGPKTSETIVISLHHASEWTRPGSYNKRDGSNKSFRYLAKLQDCQLDFWAIINIQGPGTLRRQKAQHHWTRAFPTFLRPFIFSMESKKLNTIRPIHNSHLLDSFF